jgi:hypothetical protein
VDLNRIIKETLQWIKLYTEIDLRSLNAKQGSEQETKLKKKNQEVERLRSEYITKHSMKMEGQTWEKLCEEGDRWGHTIGRQVTGNGYAKEVQKWICKGSTEIQTKHSSINIHKHTNILQ